MDREERFPQTGILSVGDEAAVEARGLAPNQAMPGEAAALQPGATASADDLASATADAAEAAHARGWTRFLPAAGVFLAIYVALFVFYRPNLLFSLTTTAGGDTGAHHYPAKFLIEYLLPNFKLTGWAPGWYAGMPMLTFYFPFPFLLIAILNVILPYQLAFKLVTVLGVFLLPVAAWAFGRLFRLRPPFPHLAAAFALVFVLMESYSIYGANILSTLAGEFGYSLSFALVWIFLGLLHRGLERRRYDWFFALTALLLMALVLSHIVTTIVLVALAPGLLLIHRRLGAVTYMAAVFVLGFLLQAFWGLPFLDKLSWTAHMSWDQLSQLKDIFPPEIRPVTAIGVLGMAYAAAKKDWRTLPLVWAVVAMVALFYLLPDGRLWNARVLPFFYFGMHLWAAYGAAWLVRPFIVMAQDLLDVPGVAARMVYAPIVAVVLGVVVVIGSTTAYGWIQWNYEGYENKAAWPQYKQINDFIASQPPGRVMVEHNDKIDKFGTPRAFEILPYWSPSHPTMEGTLMEAAFTAPYHFINQAELSVQPSNAIVGVQYPTRNTARGITHLQLMNIPYLITATPEVTGEVGADPRADLLATIDEFSIFRIAGTTGYVEVMRNQPVRLQVEDWRTPIVEWYTEESALQVPVVWDRGEPGLAQFRQIGPEEVATPPVQPILVDGGVVAEEISEEKLVFETTAVGQPHWVKISYFPNWKVKGAEGPYVASPSFMMVIPTQREVTLYFGRTWSNNLGQLLTFAGWVIVLVIVGLEIRRRRSRAVS